MHPTSESVFAQLKSKHSNTRCFDCSTKESDWCSVSHGIFLCLKCAGKHRGFGVHISFVKSITMDTWNFKHLQMMKAGGNEELQTFFDYYNLENYAHQDKYRTKAAYYYREMLKNVSEGMVFDKQKPSVDEGKTIIEEQKRVLPQKVLEKPSETDSQGIKALIGNTFEYTKYLGINIKEKTTEVNITDTEHKAKGTINKTESEAGGWNFKEKFKSVKSKTEGVYNKIAAKAKKVMKKNNEEQIFDDSKLEEGEDEILLDPQGKNMKK
ncbi:hypothetical protein SteCoe_37061 [Stentor coeruleus]|uniref:Arf-GAP domain-containing protein n=1 Tax=Stentor coeruleus TaxID=5963 RepID=A0A1R2ANR8_9CILI|nr:hypothetical protein SteCoe_37061 [Stentor coeruleus]